jgi:hypothetical protein
MAIAIPTAMNKVSGIRFTLPRSLYALPAHRGAQVLPSLPLCASFHSFTAIAGSFTKSVVFLSIESHGDLSEQRSDWRSRIVAAVLTTG